MVQTHPQTTFERLLNTFKNVRFFRFWIYIYIYIYICEGRSQKKIWGRPKTYKVLHWRGKCQVIRIWSPPLSSAQNKSGENFFRWPKKKISIFFFWKGTDTENLDPRKWDPFFWQKFQKFQKSEKRGPKIEKIEFF